MSAVAIVKTLGIAIVLGRHPVEPGVTVHRSVSQAGLEESRADDTIAGGRVHKKVVHDENAIGNQRVETSVEAGETVKPAIRVGDELHPASRILVEEIEQGLHFGVGRKRGAVEGEIPLDQVEKLRAILRYGRTDNHRASLASV